MADSFMERVTATAPGGIGNIGPGLDVLGCALAGARDEVTAEWIDVPGVSLLEPGHVDLPKAAMRHTSAIAAAAVLHEVLHRGVELPNPGIALRVKKGLPLSGGQGGSAASAVAGAVAANILLGNHLDEMTVLECCLVAEAKVAGRHLDNIAPSLLGGIILVRSISPIEVIKLPVPTSMCVVLAHPAQRLSTATARRALPRAVQLSTTTHQMAQVASMVAACYANDVALFGRAMDDQIAEPARAPLLPGFIEAKRGALEAGALGASISGAGPTSFAIADDLAKAEGIAAAMREGYASAKVECATSITTIDQDGAQVKSL
jgi:homoserine kinase